MATGGGKKNILHFLSHSCSAAKYEKNDEKAECAKTEDKKDANTTSTEEKKTEKPGQVVKLPYSCKVLRKDLGQLSLQSQAKQASGEKDSSTHGLQIYATYFCHAKAREQGAPCAPSAPKNKVD